MLILTRGVGESIVIQLEDGQKIYIRYVGFNTGRGTRVKIGIAAPLSVIIDREEVYERKEREKIAATTAEPITKATSEI